MEILKIFLAQYATIFLLGLQSMNIRDGKKVMAAITSLCLGVSGFLTTGIISQHYEQGMFSGVFFAFLLAGPAGIVCSMYAHEYFWNKC